jgi:phosphate transport system protein
MGGYRASMIAKGRLEHVDRVALEASLHDAEQHTLDLFDVLRELLGRAVKAATDSDTSVADEVTTHAGELEQRYAETHDRLLALMALQAPVASDLRLAIALLHVNDRLDRIGAQIVNIAKLCCEMPQGARPSADQLACLSEMAGLTEEQVAEAATILAQRDPRGAERLRRHDLAINEHNRRCFALAVHDGADEARREAAFFVALMARALERIGDNAVDIARQAAFVATGRLRPDA